MSDDFTDVSGGKMSSYLFVGTALLLPGAIAWASLSWEGDPPTLVGSAPFLMLFGLMLAGIYWIAVRCEKRSSSQLGFKNAGWRSLLLAIPLSLFFIFAYGPAVFAFVDWLDLGDFGDTVERLRQLPNWYLILTIVIVAGGEEWLYRGYAIERLEQLTGNVWLAGAISLLAFALAHLPLWQPGPTFSTLFAGAILTILYIHTRDVLMLMLAHMGTDLYGLVLTRMV